jgi:hypothetical protein
MRASIMIIPISKAAVLAKRALGVVGRRPQRLVRFI